ncbi:hypothetical protein D910_10302 [Dendroctonus ponderosae]
MFTFPPYPPKDYELKDVPKIQRSSPQFTPGGEPRVTQSTLGQFCSPIEYQEGETPKKIQGLKCSQHMLEKWTNEARAFWVDEPGKDDYFLHDLFRKFDVKRDSYDPAYRHKEKVFNRSYKYELVCLEEQRLQKLREKCQREQSALEESFRTAQKKEHAESHPPMKVVKCVKQPPFWWQDCGNMGDLKENAANFNLPLSLEAPANRHPGRWAKEPCLTAVVVDDPCRRKHEMHSYVWLEGLLLASNRPFAGWQNYSFCNLLNSEMEKIVTENLFLLEFLVDNVQLGEKCECDAPPGETCVSFQFLDNAPLDVCEADFSPKRNLKKGDKESVKSGKSCLFSLSPEQAAGASEQFDICVSVMKKMQPGWLPEKVEIGNSLISIANLFNELISSVELSDGSSPTAKTLKDDFDINDPQGSLIGKISVYVRMSCFGKLIVTQFQMNLDDKSVLFKDKEGKSLYRYKKYNKDCPRTPCGGQKPPQQQDFGKEYDCPFAPCGVDQPPNFAQSAPMGSSRPMNYGSTQAPGFGTQTMMTPCNECGFVPNPACMPPMPPMMMGGYTEVPLPVAAPTPEGNYQEIGASMGGNSLTIRVHKDKGKLEPVDPNGDDCICGGNDVNPGAVVPVGYPNKTQQVFAMRPGASPNSPFSFKMGQCGDSPPVGGSNGNNIVVNPPVHTAPDGTQFTEFSDPNKETFILRIGKKSEGIDKKNNLELELQTPKAPPLKPIPKKETIETQWDPQDAGAEDTGSKKSKGKADKGGKGKGKKKK